MLTTLARAKSLLGLAEEDISQDALLLISLKAASRAIEDRCRRSFCLLEHIEHCTGLPGPFLSVRQYPIRSVSSIMSDHGGALDPFEIVEETPGLLYRACGWPRGERSIVITYRAGYVLPEQGTEEEPSDLPETLEWACVLLAQHLQRTPGVQSERVGDISVTYSSTPNITDMPAAVEALIAPHIRIL
ncbi:phage head-tail connector protein [Paenibacillus sepulcri]|uniref:Phage head-tail connector protein n=1 Tax=Paenibacillus sepulcri TaxID=359917 RepID=A0ABS7BVD4_9BACL|nr:phage head-tail connector protein [Paenibacillus sepulcri]